MTKIGGGDPCPCGSGRTYEDCCGGRQTHEAGLSPSQEILRLFQEKYGDRSFESVAEMQEALEGIVEERTRTGLEDFLGLSPDALGRMLYGPLERTEGLVEWNPALEAEDFREIPIVEKSVYLLGKVAEVEPLKGTAKGNLPLKFVQELAPKVAPGMTESYTRYGRALRSEEDLLDLLCLRHVLTMSGWMRKVHGKFLLTKAGRRLVDKGFGPAHFRKLFETYTRKFNWAFRGWGAEFRIVQQGYLFSLFMVRKLAREEVPFEVLGDAFIRAFPPVLDEARAHLVYWRRRPEEDVHSVFLVRFLKGFCVPFGLAELREERGPSKRDLPRYHVRAAGFLDRVFLWRVDGNR